MYTITSHLLTPCYVHFTTNSSSFSVCMHRRRTCMYFCLRQYSRLSPWQLTCTVPNDSVCGCMCMSVCMCEECVVSMWVSVCVCEWVCACMSEWVCGVHVWVCACVNECAYVWACMSECVYICVSEYVHVWVSVWACLSECVVCKCRWVCAYVSWCAYVWANVDICEWVCVHVWVCSSVLAVATTLQECGLNHPFPVVLFSHHPLAGYSIFHDTGLPYPQGRSTLEDLVTTDPCCPGYASLLMN